MPIKRTDRAPPITDLPRSVTPFLIAGRLWELQFEFDSRLGGAFAALIYSALSSTKLQIPGSFAANLVKWPVELAQDDSWRMESGTGTRFMGTGLGGRCGALSWLRETGAESWQGSYGSLEEVLSDWEPDLQWQAEGTTVGAEYYLLSS